MVGNEGGERKTGGGTNLESLRSPILMRDAPVVWRARRLREAGWSRGASSRTTKSRPRRPHARSRHAFSGATRCSGCCLLRRRSACGGCCVLIRSGSFRRDGGGGSSCADGESFGGEYRKQEQPRSRGVAACRDSAGPDGEREDGAFA